MEYHEIRSPRIMIAAPGSGSGKTLVTCGLLRLLKKKGYRAGAFKCGPDYIDPMFHRQVLGVPSVNLDTFFAEPPLARGLLLRGAETRDIAVLEGVMGYFDGIGAGGMAASSYDAACVTETPVVLTVSARGMSRSLVPLIRGFVEYGEQHLIRGVILNRMRPMLYPAMKKMIESELELKVLGYVPEDPAFRWESRQLGLVQPAEGDLPEKLQRQMDVLAERLEESLDLEEILRIAGEAAPLSGSIPDVSHEGRITGEAPFRGLRIAVARDEAFSFYYEENLELLRELGAELVLFSPIRDRSLPEADGILLGGGYPELWGALLEENKEMRCAVKQAASGGIPVLAECGGFMYLQEALTGADGVRHEMCGVLPGESSMREKLVRFGYVSVQEKKAGDWLPAGQPVRGHEFHYSDSTDNGDSCTAVRASGTGSWDCIHADSTIFAGYPHLYYRSCPEFAAEFLRRCGIRRQLREERRQKK